MKRKITEVSIKLFEKKGFSATSIQDIVDAIGVTKGTFYYYYSSKEQLLMDIHYDYITNLLERQKQIVDNSHLSQREKITEIITLLIMDVTEKGPSARVFFRELRHLSEGNIEKIKEIRKQFYLNVEAVIKAGIEQGEFRKADRPDMLAYGVLGIVNWSYNWYNPEGDVSPSELAKIYANVILKGIEN
ncbi:TetR/AcrR family transcriptional regulator [Bacilli bacterium]|nr:TetR family transcriptional regulator [Bacilli bacterium VT-13-104]PZD89792.1 TetR/AcrR family transcriptional regulator [Bacilli bacterium]PZD91314.1 TetR/AcrR family transcriptional regulator [Bacilli bacterium]PZD92854.1 TetR/AcrR family transcriptional regulator [Bacilli bacterium]RCO07615.1 TetR/AcrR family transcriptional regulator [Bacilli bacterium]